MRIGINAWTFSLHESGVGRYIRGLLTGLERVGRGHDFVLYIEDDFLKTIPSLPENFNVRSFSKRRLKNHILFTSLYLPIIVGRDRLDILHHTNPVFFPLFEPISVITIHDINEFIVPSAYPPLKNLYRKAVVLFNIKARRGIITDSIASEMEIRKRFGIDSNRVKGIQLGVEHIFRRIERDEAERVVAEKFGIFPPYLLYVGRIDVPIKNLINLLKGFEMVLPHLPEDLTLVLAGKPGFRADEIYSFVKERGLKSRVRFTGLVSDEILPYMISGSVCLVALSISEGFGLPPLEAMACGKTVIVSNRSSFPEVVGEAGLMVDPEDPSSISDAMKKVVIDSELRKTLEEKASLRARLFTWEKTAELTLSTYQRFLSIK